MIVHTLSGGTSSPTVTGVSPNHGPTGGGGLVTVTGSGFNSGNVSVSFGSAVTRDLTVDSNTQITVTISTPRSTSCKGRREKWT